MLEPISYPSVAVYVSGLQTGELEKIIARRWDDENLRALYAAVGAWTREQQAVARRLARDAAEIHLRR